jgi:hypothetical protein
MQVYLNSEGSVSLGDNPNSVGIHDAEPEHIVGLPELLLVSTYQLKKMIHRYFELYSS